jgi:hypothetical protein
MKELCRKCFTSFVCVTVFTLSVPTPSFSQPVPALAASTALNAAGLGALAFGIHGLVGDAVSQLNNDLADRLRQLEAIVNSAVFALQTTINYGIDKLDFTMQSNLRVLNNNAQDLLTRYGALTKATLKDADRILDNRITQAGDALGNAVAQVNILNTTPVLNVPTSGVAIFRARNNTTQMYVTGVGLTKLGVIPEVTLIKADKSIVTVNVLANTMAFLKLSIPTNAISRDGSYTLSFKFCVGSNIVGWKQYVYPSLSLLVCPIPKFTISTRLWVEGDAWETRIRNMNEGNLMGGAIYGVQIGGGNGNQPLPIVARAASGWELYDHAGWGRVINCVRNDANGYTDMGYSGGNTCTIYVDGRQGNAHLNVVAQVAERRRIHKNECSDAFTDQRDLIGTVTSPFEFSRPRLNGSCDSGLILKALFKSSLGDALPDFKRISRQRPSIGLCRRRAHHHEVNAAMPRTVVRRSSRAKIAPFRDTDVLRVERHRSSDERGATRRGLTHGGTTSANH